MTTVIGKKLDKYRVLWRKINDQFITEPRLQAKSPMTEDEEEKITTGDDGSQATKLVKLTSDIELFHTPNMKAYAIVPIKNHKECWPITSDKFEHWILGHFYKRYKSAASPTAYQTALNVLQCKALHDGAQEPVHIRVAGNDSKILIDLGDSDWRAVEVTANGWNLLPSHPVRFVRSNTMRPLPIPIKGGNLNELRDFLNLASDEDYVLLAMWLISALRPEGPFPLLLVSGEQGSSKSTLCRVLQSLIDPHQPSLRSQPTNERDLMISASHLWMLVYDNISKVPAPMSDAFCRLSTGGGFATRKLYSDDEEQIFNSKRPVILNGITEIANRSDLLDRSINLVLPPIPLSQRKTETAFWKKFDDSRPRIFGALLTTLSTALARLNSVQLTEMPRMADFAKFSVAAESEFAVKQGTFMRAYLDNRQIQNAELVASSPVGSAIQQMLEQKNFWSGDAQTLLKELKHFSDWKTREQYSWPQTPRGMSSTLRYISPNLRSIGIDVEFLGKTGHAGIRLITLKKLGNESPASPAPPARRRKVTINKQT